MVDLYEKQLECSKIVPQNRNFTKNHSINFEKTFYLVCLLILLKSITFQKIDQLFEKKLNMT